MSLIVNSSPDLSLLSVEITYDLSGVVPVINLTNLSQGLNLADVDYVFRVQSPTLTYIHDGSFTPTPDESGVWISSVIADPWPRPFNSIEYGLYRFTVIAKDSTGTEYTAPIQTTKICRPNGNLPTSQNAYGLGQVVVQTKCDQARIYFQDVTNTSYQGLTGTIGSSVLRVNFPMDNTGTVPAPFQIGYFSSAMVPITYSGKGYQFLYTSIWEYDLGDQSFVRIKYLLNDTFGVWCGIDLMPLICEYQKLIQSIEDGSCTDSDAAQRKLMLINPKFSLLMIGILQPLTGVDVPTLITEIEEIGDFDCDCCNVASGVLPQGTNAFEGYTFTVVPQGGDIGGSFTVNGYNIQLNLDDVSYIFKICDSSPAQTTAFSVIPSLSSDGYTKTYCLNIEMDQLAEDILNVIKTDAGLVNLFNSIVINAGGTFTLIVDGKCIFSSSSTYSYAWTLTDIPLNTTFGQLAQFILDDSTAPILFSFNMTNLPAVQAYLNTLGLGTFVVAATGATTVSITSTGNPNNINTLVYSPFGSTKAVATMTKTQTGYTAISANQVVQNIIDYLCELDDSQVVTSQAYDVCYIDEDGVKQTETIAAGESLADFLLALTTRGCTTIDYIVSLGSVNCATIKAQFPSSVAVMQANDYFLGTKETDCARILPVEAFLMMLTYGQYSTEVITAFCNMVTLCAAGNVCDPYSVFNAEVIDGSPGSDLIVTFTNPTAVSHNISYARIDNTVSPVYTTITGILPGDSPYTIPASPGIDNGQYRVRITPIYADGRTCNYTEVDTLPCTGITAFNAVYDGVNVVLTFSTDESISYVKWNLQFPNGGFGSAIAAATSPIIITLSSGIYGTFYASLQPVCDIDTGYFGVATAPATFEIPETSP